MVLSEKIPHSEEKNPQIGVTFIRSINAAYFPWKKGSKKFKRATQDEFSGICAC